MPPATESTTARWASDDEPDFHAGPRRRARLAIVHADFAGDHAAAVEHLRDVLAIARALEHQPVLIGHLCAVFSLAPKPPAEAEGPEQGPEQGTGEP